MSRAEYPENIGMGDPEPTAPAADIPTEAPTEAGPSRAATGAADTRSTEDLSMLGILQSMQAEARQHHSRVESFFTRMDTHMTAQTNFMGVQTDILRQLQEFMISGTHGGGGPSQTGQPGQAAGEYANFPTPPSQIHTPGVSFSDLEAWLQQAQTPQEPQPQPQPQPEDNDDDDVMFDPDEFR